MTGRLSAGLIDTFKRCHPGFQWSQALNPRRTLTMPCDGTANDGWDNDNADLILRVHDVLVAQHGNRCVGGRVRRGEATCVVMRCVWWVGGWRGLRRGRLRSETLPRPARLPRGGDGGVWRLWTEGALGAAAL